MLAEITGHASRGHFTGHFVGRVMGRVKNYGARFTKLLHGALHGNYGALHGALRGALHGALHGALQNCSKTAFRLAPKNRTLKFCLGGPRPPFLGAWSQIWDPLCLFGSLLGFPFSPEGDLSRDLSSLKCTYGRPKMH